MVGIEVEVRINLIKVVKFSQNEYQHLKSQGGVELKSVCPL